MRAIRRLATGRLRYRSAKEIGVAPLNVVTKELEMPAPQYASLESIMVASKRTHFTQADGEYLLSIIKKSAQTGRNLNLHPIMQGAVKEAFDDGMIALKAADLDADFLLVKLNAGRGLFGGVKSRVMAYVGSVEDDRLMPSVLSKNLIMATASINAAYKNQGL